MGFTSAIGLACIISMSACGEPGRVELSDQKRTEVASTQCPAGALEAVIPLDLSKVLPIVIPPGKTSSRRTVVAAAAVADVRTLDVELPEIEIPELDLPEAVAVLEAEPAALELQDEPKRSVLPPLPPLRDQSVKALISSDDHEQADLLLASLQVSGTNTAVRHITTDNAPQTPEEPELDRQVEDSDAAANTSRAELSDKPVAPIAPAILPDRAVISDRPLDAASVAELSPSDEASELELALEEVRILQTQETVHRIVPSGEPVCEVVMFSPREIALIGRRSGTMQLDFWYDSQGIHRTRYWVTVHEAPTSPKVPVDEAQRIETLIQQHFPGSRIECQREARRLIVRGYAQNERQAIDIISTIRRSQLIPVVDLIEIRAPERRNQRP